MELSQEQKQVIETQNKSLLVSASAGSGKTFVVIERIIDSIKQGTDVSRLLVLTFTNAAASELKERLTSRLHTLKEEYIKIGDTENVSRIAKQISRVPMSDISTIHSFCLNIIRNNFYSLGIDPNITTLDATKATIMINEAIIETVEEEYEKKSEEFLDILDILATEDNLVNNIYMLYNSYKNIIDSDKWIEQIIDTYNTKEDTDLSNTEFGQVIIGNIKDRLEILKLQLEYEIDKLDGIEDFASRKDMLNVILRNIQIAIHTNTYDELYNCIPNLLSIPRLPSTKVLDEELKEEIKNLKTKVSDELKEISTILYKNSEGIIQDLNNSLKYINWYKNVIQSVSKKYENAKKIKCVIDFADYEHLAIKALEDENTRNKYIEKYEQIYIDEYQDTSNAQEAIIQKIAKSNNVIMVGDVKQSIYAFRNAKPELFTNKYELFQEVTENENSLQAKIILSKNFRSRKEVLDSTNAIFSLLMSRNFGGSNYGKAEELTYGEGYDYSQKQNYTTELNIIEKKSGVDTEETLENLTDLEIESILASKKIINLVENKFQIYDLKKKEYRDCKYKDIVILLRTVDGKADIIKKVLESYGIPCFTDSKSGFYKSEEISLITAFLNVLDNPYDDISMVSIMYSIMGNFSLDELAVLRRNNISKPVIECLNDAVVNSENEKLKNKAIKFLKLLEKFKKYLKTYKVSETLLKLYEETGIYETLRIEKMGELKCANLDNFIQIISDFEKTEKTTSLYTLIKYLRVLKSKESSSDSPKLIGENEDVVRIMTMHKSKGLEFPIVILMNTAAKYNEQDIKDKLQFDDKLGIGIDIYDKEMMITYPSIIKQAIKVKTKKTLRSESLRILYVAFTRAKEKLIICGTVDSLDKYSSKIMEIKNKRTSELVAASYNSHLKCILQGAIGDDNHFIVNVHNIKDFNVIQQEKESLSRNNDKLENINQKAKEYNIQIEQRKIDELKDRFIKDNKIIEINKKYTVTELKTSTLNFENLKPEVLNQKITGTSYGTFIHSIIEHLDYNKVTKESISTIVDRIANSLSMNDKINKKYIVQDILTMYDNLEIYLKNAKCIKNELEFVIKSKLEDIPQANFEKPTLIQGVVDMYIVTEEGKHIIIDFKTDKVENSVELIEKYKIQLMVYKKAIELAINEKVEATYIYSFALKKLIEVKV